MARVEVPITVITPAGTPVSGASVAITLRSNGSAATWYTAETGGVGSTAPASTDANGRIAAWVDRGAYNCTISGSGITTYVEAFDATPGGDQTVDPGWVSAAFLPPGLVVPYGGGATPNANVWLLCDGSAVSRTGTYANLFNAIGTTYGVGNGTSTFNIPDGRGRAIFGLGTHADVNALNDQDALTLANRTPNHAHASGTLSVASHAHRHISPIALNSGTVGVVPPDRAELDFYGSYAVLDTPGNATVEIGGATFHTAERWVVTSEAVAPAVNAGTTATGFIPYLTLNYLIKV